MVEVETKGEQDTLAGRIIQRLKVRRKKEDSTNNA